MFIYPWPSQVNVFRQVLIDVNRFEGELQGDVTLAVRWILVDAKDEQVQKISTFRVTEPVARNPEDPYIALVAAESRAVSALSEEIAREILNRQSGQPEEKGPK